MNTTKKDVLYNQIKQAIQDSIIQNDLRAGHRLPSEHQLMKQYHISRITVRRALAELEKDGLVIRRHGKGTYVAGNRLKGQLSHLSSFTEDMRERGFSTHARVIEFRIIEPDREIIDSLNLPEGETVVMLRRVRYADRNPIALEACYLPASRFSDILQEDFSLQSLNRLMQVRYNIRFSYARQYISTSISSRDIMRDLEIETPVSILTMRRIVYDVNNWPVQYTLSYYRGDLYEYEVTLQM